MAAPRQQLSHSPFARLGCRFVSLLARFDRRQQGDGETVMLMLMLGEMRCKLEVCVVEVVGGSGGGGIRQ